MGAYKEKLSLLDSASGALGSDPSRSLSVKHSLCISWRKITMTNDTMRFKADCKVGSLAALVKVVSSSRLT